jgi:hypothetical protein
MASRNLSQLELALKGCPFFIDGFCGTCVSRGILHPPDTDQKELHCQSTEFRSCDLYSVRAIRNIRVVYADNTADTVADFALESLIREGRIKKFCRSDGWVVIGQDPIRGMGGQYSGPERRKTNRKR